MKKIVVISDTHGSREFLKQIEGVMLESDYVLHLGDGIGDMRPYRDALGERLVTVRGNCDCSVTADERELEVEGCTLFLTHGHRYRVKTTLVNVGYAGCEHHAAAVLYGHTHVADVTEFEGIKLINPGSLSRPMSGVPSYCYLLVYNGKVFPKIVELGR